MMDVALYSVTRRATGLSPLADDMQISLHLLDIRLNDRHALCKSLYPLLLAHYLVMQGLEVVGDDGARPADYIVLVHWIAQL
jgi:hypothetical protein